MCQIGAIAQKLSNLLGFFIAIQSISAVLRLVIGIYGFGRWREEWRWVRRSNKYLPKKYPHGI